MRGIKLDHVSGIRQRGRRRYETNLERTVPQMKREFEIGVGQRIDVGCIRELAPDHAELFAIPSPLPKIWTSAFRGPDEGAVGKEHVEITLVTTKLGVGPDLVEEACWRRRRLGLLLARTCRCEKQND